MVRLPFTTIFLLTASFLFTPLAAQTPRFEKDVLSIFSANCFSCHGGTSIYTNAGLDLRSATSTLRGSHNGPVVVEGSPAESLLFQKVSKREMPPPAFKLKLTDEQIETIRKWIEAGAPSDEEEEMARKLAQQTEKFETEALPILITKCVACHAGATPKGELDLTSFSSLLKGSAKGPVVVEGASDKSVLIRNVMSRIMPPPGAGEPLTDEEIRTLRQWIDTARFSEFLAPAHVRETFTKEEAPEVSEKDRQFWAFRKPVAPPIPKVKDKKRVRTPIDAFVLAKLEEKGLTFSPEASKLTLMRRAYFDLIGLPPRLEEMEAFLSDSRPDAYERLIDRLLASPHYGERWGRHWLDAIGYTDIMGWDHAVDSINVFEGIWRYRDYVVRSFNEDKPYDRFLTEQLAGDELVNWRSAEKYTPEIVEALTATGYLRSVYDVTDSDIVNLPHERYETMFYLGEKVSNSLFGLTMQCARCHSHKYDPISQRDYYRFLAIFAPAYNPSNWLQPKNRYLPNVSKAEQEEIERHNAEIDRPLGELKEEVKRLRRPYEEGLLTEKLQALPEAIRAEARAALETPAEKRDSVQEYLVQKFAPMLKVMPEEVDKALNEADRETVAKLDNQIETLNGYRRSFEKIQALWDIGPSPVMRLLQRGSVEHPGPKVQPGVPTVLSPPGESDIGRPPGTQGESSHYRLALARWLTRPEHPLTTRVAVNRIWQRHFGRGIVETSDNFGRQGSPPTHPELLDWLAVDFREKGWTLKRLHKMIMTSTVYRQLSHKPHQDEPMQAEKGDPENRLLWRMNLRRLEAEAIRDAILSATGKLDPSIGGPAIMLKPDRDGLQTVFDKKAGPNAPWRRSLYLLARRNWPMDFLHVFDFPTIQVTCTRRTNSATPLQSLTMLNSEFMIEQGRRLAERVNSLVGDKDTDEKDRGKKIEVAYLLTLSRKPTGEELQICREHVQKQREVYRVANVSPEKTSNEALASLCQMLMSSNEFLYLD